MKTVFYQALDENSEIYKITDAKLHIPLVTLSTKGNVNLTKQLSDVFKRPVYWNNFETNPAKVRNKGSHIYELLSAWFQGNKRFFVLAYVIVQNEKHNVLIDGRNFYGQPINNLITQYNEVRKVSARQGDDYTARCLLDYAYFNNYSYKLVAVDLIKQKALYADPKAIEQIVFEGGGGGDDNIKIMLYTILEKSKETVLESYKGTAKVL